MTLKSYYSQRTQDVANNYPHWSRVRQRWDSNGQIYMNPFGITLEDMNTQLTTQLSNYFIPTNNLDELSVNYRLPLPKNYTFGFDTSNPERIIPLAPHTIGFLSDGTQHLVQATRDNTIESIWHRAQPTRISTGTTVSKGIILAPTLLSSLTTALLSLPSKPNRLLLTLNGGSEFIQAGLSRQASVEIQGITRKGSKETEQVFFSTNQSILSFKEWKEVTKVTVRNVIPDSATLKIETFEFNRDSKIDTFSNIFESFTKEEKIIQYRLSNVTAGSTVEEHVPVSIDPNMIAQGISNTKIFKKHLLYNINKDLITDIVDFAIQPFSQIIYAISNTKLYLFDILQEYPNIKGLKNRTNGPQTIIETNSDNTVVGDILRLEAVRQIPLRRVIKHEWTVILPDGNSFKLRPDGTQAPLSDNTEIQNKDFTSFTFSYNKVNYPITQSGTYIFQLKTTYHDNTVDIDKRVIDSTFRQAIAEFDLTTFIPNPSGISFDSDQQLWICDAYLNQAYLINLHKDLMLIDFKRKILYFHENYDKVEVEVIDG